MSNRRRRILGTGIVAALALAAYFTPWHALLAYPVKTIEASDDGPPWLPLEGEVLSTEGYPALFRVLGNRYGGDGKSTFSLPKVSDEDGHDFLANAQFGSRLLYRCIATRDLEDHTPAGTMAWCTPRGM